MHEPHDHISLGSPRELAQQDFEFVVRRVATDIAMGADASPFVGSGLEYSSSRPYQPGDPARSMNWRLSARHGRPYVKQFEVLKRVPMFVVVDTSRSMAVSSTPLSKRDVAVWVAAVMGLIGLRRLSPVAIATHGRQVPRPSLSRTDLWLGLEPLRGGHAPIHTSLSDVLSRVEATARAASIVMVISDFHEPAAVDAALACAGRHDVIAVRLVDPAERGRLGAGFFRGQESETGAGFLGHGWSSWQAGDQGLGRLVRAGADVMTFDTTDRLAPLLRQFLGSRAEGQRRRR